MRLWRRLDILSTFYKGDDNVKIAYVRTQFGFNLEVGGAVSHTLGVLDGFKKNGCELFIISNESFLGIEYFNYSIIKPKSKKYLEELQYNFYTGRMLERKIIEVKPDLIYHRKTKHTFVVSKIAKKLRIPIVLEVNGLAMSLMGYRERRRGIVRGLLNCIIDNIAKRIEAYVLENASLIVVISQVLKTELLKMGISEEKILMNPNGVDTDKFNPEVERSEKCKDLRQQLKIQNKVVVGFSGMFSPWHGIPQLTQAISRILKEQLLSNIHFLLIGDGPLKAEAENMVGHYDSVTFTGIVPYSEIQYYLAICDVLVSPHSPQADGSEFIGSPMKIFEYMTMGKGIVASILGQIGEVLKHNNNAILIESGNVNQLVKGISKLAKNKELREKLGKNARESAVRSYTWERNVERVIRAAQGLSN